MKPTTEKKKSDHRWKPETISAFQAAGGKKKGKRATGEKPVAKPRKEKAPKPYKMPRSMEEQLAKMMDAEQWKNPICDSSRGLNGIYRWRELQDDPPESLFVRCKKKILRARVVELLQKRQREMEVI